MKVLYVVPSYEPAWTFGGTVTATSNICRALAKQGVDVTVYTTDADGKGGNLDVPLNEPIDIGGVKVWYFRCDFGIKKAFYSKRLTNNLKKTNKDFDLVHVSAIWQWMQVEVSRVSERVNIPYIVTPHNSLSKLSMRFSKNIKKYFYWWLWSKNTIKKATALHFLCEGERKISIQNTFFVPSFVVPNGIDCNLYKGSINYHSKVRNELGIDHDSIVLLFLGRVHPDKRLQLIIEAMGQLGKHNSFILIFVGPIVDENYFKYLQKLIKNYNLENKIQWIGPVDNDDIIKFYSMSDLFVLLSEFEGVSMSSIEALAAGLPLLISRGIANGEEIIKDEAGILVDNESGEIVKKLRQIQSGKINLTFLSNQARKSAENRYDIDKVAFLMIKAYEDILTGKKSPELQWM